VAQGDDGLRAFLTVYADPLVVNGSETPLVDLVERARMLQRAIEPLHHEKFQEFDAPGRAAFAFRLHGRHVGPLRTPLGDVAATGMELEMRGMDILELDDDFIVAVWAVGDWLPSLSAARAVRLTNDRSPT
jgi:hypothetical protein